MLYYTYDIPHTYNKLYILSHVVPTFFTITLPHAVQENIMMDRKCIKSDKAIAIERKMAILKHVLLS